MADSSEDDRKTRPYAAEASEPTGRVPQRNEVDAETGGEGMELDIDVGTEDVTDEAIEGSGQHAGMGRGEKPRKLKSEEK